jgi:triosephosphate isomerase
MSFQNNRLPLFAANWKMHKTLREAKIFFEDLLGMLPLKLDCEVAIFPPFPLLHQAFQWASGRLALGAQDVFWEAEGAYTGEVSPVMLKDAGCSYVLVAHSERRRYFGESDTTANKKILSALEHGLKPILCVGETLEEMESRKTKDVVKRQVFEGLQNFRLSDASNLVLAYEPVWAIGTGKADTPEQSNQTIGFIRSLLSEMFGYHEAQKIRILYGGSVKPENIAPFMAQPEIDGALVGGASLSAESFSRIVQFREIEKPKAN